MKLWAAIKCGIIFYKWAYIYYVGISMNETAVRIDEKGRVRIPKRIRETAQLREGSYVTIKIDGKVIKMEPAEPAADKYFGAFPVTKWPDDIDEFIVEVMQKTWTKKST